STIESMMSLIVEGDWSRGSGARPTQALTMTAAQTINLRYLFTRVVYEPYENSLDACAFCGCDGGDGDSAGATSDSDARTRARGAGAGTRPWRTGLRRAASAGSAAGGLGNRAGHSGGHGA